MASISTWVILVIYYKCEYEFLQYTISKSTHICDTKDNFITYFKIYWVLTAVCMILQFLCYV